MNLPWTTILLIMILLMILAILIILVVLLARTGASARDEQTEIMLEELKAAGLQMLDDTGDELSDRISLNVAEIRQDVNARLVHDSEENRRNRVEVSDMLSRSQDKMERSLKLALFEMQESNKFFDYYGDDIFTNMMTVLDDIPDTAITDMYPAATDIVKQQMAYDLCYSDKTGEEIAKECADQLRSQID